MRKIPAAVPSSKVDILGNKYAVYKIGSQYAIKDIKTNQIFDASAINTILDSTNLKLFVFTTDYNDRTNENGKYSFVSDKLVEAPISQYVKSDQTTKYELRKSDYAYMAYDRIEDVFFLSFEENVISKTHTYEIGLVPITNMRHHSILSITKFRLHSDNKKKRDEDNYLEIIKTIKIHTPMNYYFYGKIHNKDVKIVNEHTHIEYTSNPKIFLLYTTGTNRKIELFDNMYPQSETSLSELTDISIPGNSVIVNLQDMKSHPFPGYTLECNLKEVLILHNDKLESSWIYDVQTTKMSKEDSLYKQRESGNFTIFEPKNDSVGASSYIYPSKDCH
jgi:hypothetical protein